MKNATFKFIHLGGIAAILAGTCMAFADIYHTMAGMLITPYDGSAAEQVGSVIFLIGRILVVFALPALYLYHADSAGRFGLIAFIVAMLGNTLMVASDWNEVIMAPILHDLDPLLLDEPPPRLMIGFIINFIPETLGWVLFGISAYRARVFPRLPSLLLTFGILLIFLPFSPSWIFIIPYSAIAWMGWVITRANAPDAIQLSPA